MRSIEDVTEDMKRELNGIIDPCSIAAGAPAGMIDMGLVREASLSPTSPASPHLYQARVRISVTHPFCLMAGVFLNEVEKRLRNVPQIDRVEASIDSSTLWRPELMTPEYRVQLAAVRRERLPDAALPGEKS